MTLDIEYDKHCKCRSMTVSVVILSFERPQLLEQALHSVCRQSFPASQIQIFISDCSISERSISEVQTVVRRFRKQYACQRFTFIQHRKRIPQMMHFQLVVQKVDTEFVALLDDDDMWESFHLDDAVKILSRNCRIGAVASHGIKVSGDGQILGYTNKSLDKPIGQPREFWFKKILSSFYGSTSGLVFRSDAIVEFIPIANSVLDLHLLITALLKGYNVDAFPRPSYFYRVHDGSCYDKSRVLADRYEWRLFLLRRYWGAFIIRYPLFFLLIIKQLLDYPAHSAIVALGS